MSEGEGVTLTQLPPQPRAFKPRPPGWEEIDLISFHVLSYVQQLPGVTHIDFVDEPRPALAAQMDGWRNKNRGFELPQDLQAFLEVTNGLAVTWSAQCVHNEITVGSLSVNPLENITRLPNGSGFSGQSSAPSEPGAAGVVSVVHGARALPERSTGFLLDSIPKVGQVALVYSLSATQGPEQGHFEGVWFRDVQSSAWHFLADSFCAYFRMLVVHLGILGWQYAFTPLGLDLLTRQWMGLYCPQRLMHDAQHAQPQPPVAATASPHSRHGRGTTDKRQHVKTWQ